MQIKINKEQANVRIDVFLKNNIDFSRSLITQNIKEGNILVNAQNIKANYKLKENDEITVKQVVEKELNVKPEDINLDIIYDDDDVIIVNKPKNMVVHPASGTPGGTVVNGLVSKFQLSENENELRPGVVHRIDKDTTGLIIFAKNNKAHNALQKQFKDKTITRKYIALVHGVIDENRAIIDAPIGRDQNDRKKMAVTAHNSKDAITNFKVLKRFDDFTLIECKLETGRTHQIRVHLKYIEHPVAGDQVYGPKKTLVDSGQLLHAMVLGFIHPTTNEYMEFTSELPKVMKEVIEELENE